jgi:hypothetical protein
MATEATIRERVYEQLYGSFPLDRPFETLLTEALDNSETAVDVTDGNDWAEGDILEMTTTGERMLVLSKATNTLTVERGYGRVAAAASSGAADRVRKNPRFSYDQVGTSITDALNALASWGVHAFATGSLTMVAGQWYFELSETDIDAQYGVLSVYYPQTTTLVPIPLPYKQTYSISTGPTDYTYGRGVTLLDKGNLAATGTAYYTYAQSLVFDTDLDTTIAKLEVPSEELVVVGACARILGYTIAPMTQDPGQRTDRTVPPGQTSRDVRFFQGEFFVKVRAEAARLAVERQRVPRHRHTQRAGRWRW